MTANVQVLDAQIDVLRAEAIDADDLAVIAICEVAALGQCSPRTRYRHPNLAARIESRGVAWARSECASEIAAAHAREVCS